MLCEYKHIFGKEKEGVHSVRLFDVAVVDVALTILGGVLIARATGVRLWIVLVLLFALGILTHRAFCVNTTVNKLVFGMV